MAGASDVISAQNPDAGWIDVEAASRLELWSQQAKRRQKNQSLKGFTDGPSMVIMLLDAAAISAAEAFIPRRGIANVVIILFVVVINSFLVLSRRQSRSSAALQR